MKIEIVSDISCPWCFVAKARLRRALAEVSHPDAITVEYLPFQLNPAMPTTPQPLLEYWLARGGPRFRDDHVRVADIAAAEGLTMRLDKALAVNTFDGHRLIRPAGHDGGPAAQAAVDGALERAYFTDGGNIADPHTLTAIAVQAGLDGDRVAAALATDLGAAEVQAAIARTRHAGIRAVPTLLVDDHYALVGARTAGDYAALFAQASLEPTPRAPGAACHLDGGCTD
ncbi:DsbA family oxidoreductase [Nocardia acidivorans]|uniref:DsbA family oxidoreductase n=1 Tax=Nocardia acidivorans TaxID=404580 RepID=UPI000830A549|nr:DsbA family oxidoreductase [Nocardia acidivorans]